MLGQTGCGDVDGHWSVASPRKVCATASHLVIMLRVQQSLPARRMFGLIGVCTNLCILGKCMLSGNSCLVIVVFAILL